MTSSPNQVITGEVFGPSEGAVVLDIGADIGAAVVHTTAALEGAEIEIVPDGSEWDGTHVAVRRRIGYGPDVQPIYCAIFSRLPAGLYRIRVMHDDQHPASHRVTVRAGQVVHVKLVDAGSS